MGTAKLSQSSKHSQNRMERFQFTIFDDDGDGVLSNREFVAVMKNKLKRGLEKPKEIGIVHLLAAITKCAKTTPLPAGPSLAQL